MVAASPLPKTGLSLASFSTEESGRRFLSRSSAAERRDQVVEEARVVRRGEVLVRRGGELVLVLAGDLPLQRGQRGVVAHRQAGARLAVLRDRQADVAGADRGERLEPRRGVAARR